MRKVLIGLFVGCLVPLAGATAALATGPGYVDVPLKGPAQLEAGQQATYSSTGGGCSANPAPKLSVEYQLNGDWTTQPTTQSLAKGGDNVKLGMTAGDFSGNGEMVITVLCPLSSTKVVRYRATVTVIGTGGPDGGEVRSDITADLDFKRETVSPGEAISGSGRVECPGGSITSSSLIVLTGSGRWAEEPQFRTFMNGPTPVLDVTKMGKPVFDGDPVDRQTIKAVLVCESPDLRVTYEGYVTVLDRAPAGTTAPSEPSIASNVRRAISVRPATVEVGSTAVISNTPASTCSGLVFLQGSSGFERSDAGKYEFAVTRGSESGDVIKADASGNWALSFTFDEEFLGDQEVRRLTISMACGKRIDGVTSFEFLYQPAAISVVAATSDSGNDDAPADQGGGQAPADDDSAGGESENTDDAATDDASTNDASTDDSGSSTGQADGGGSSSSLGGSLAIPTGDVVDAAGNQILPRAYLDGDTQQLIELTTGRVIGEYDVVSGQFVDPSTGEVTGIVDPVTGELIDAATGILIGVSVTPEGASEDPSLIGLGDSTDDSGSNVLVIVLAAVAGALLVTVIALVLSRRKKPSLPPPAA